MKRTSLCLQFCLVLTATVFFSSVQAQQVFKTTSKSVIGYLEYLPQGYNNNSNNYPLVIFLHGKGEKGPNGTSPSTLKGGVDKLTKLGPPHYVKKGTQFPFILISPQLKSSISEWSSAYVLEVLNHVKKYLRVDDNRVYITGLSLGGGGAWVIAQENPGLFAAVAPVCGSWNSTNKACGFSENGTGVWAFHGDKDTTIPLSRTLNMVNAINGCSPKPDPRAKVTIYPGIKHNAWDKAYLPDHSVHSQNLYEWLLTFRRSSTTKPQPDRTLTLSAGADKEVKLPTNSVSITASVSGDAESYKWTQLSGAGVKISGASSKTLELDGLKQGEYSFRITVKYKSGSDTREVSDDVIVRVKAGSNTNPVASAGSDKTLSLPTNRVVLDGKGSDKDNDALSYSWQQQQGGRVTMSGASSPDLSIADLKEGTYVFRLTVKDNRGGQHYDEVTVTVKGTSNDAPVASAGRDYVLNLPDNHVSLQGRGTDKNNDPLTYQWKQQEGGRVTMRNAQSPKLDVSNLKEGRYRFRLTVRDKNGASHYDEATIEVRKPSNTTPVASAGGDKAVTLPSNHVVLAGKGTDADKDKLTFQWKQQEGGRVTMKNAQSPTLDVSNLKEGSYRFRLTVKDSHGAQHYDDVNITVRKS